MKVLIVGGGAAGASAAARLRRLDEKAEIIIFERTNEISIANCGLPYYCSDVINDRSKMLVSNVQTFKELLNVEVRLNSPVTSINRDRKTITISGYEEGYDKLVLATGASPIKPPIEGIGSEGIFTVRTLEDADRIKEFIKSKEAKTAVVIGGGFIGVEMAENLAHLGLKTSLIELQNQILAPLDYDMAVFAQNKMRDNGVELVLSDGVRKFENSKVFLNSEREIDYDVAILAIGVKAEVSLARDSGLEIGATGAIKVNSRMQTSDADIYAAGDGVEVLDFVSGNETIIPLAGPANRQGRIIADNIAGFNSEYKNTQGTAVVKVFDLTVASVGNNEKQLKKRGVNYLKTYVQANAHAGYYPGATPLTIKLLFDESGKIFGAQAVGNEGVEKRIDIISSVMRLGGKVQDLIDSELSYAPPYSSAKDSINLAGMASDNLMKGLVKLVYWDEIDFENDFLIDVRPSEVFKISTIEGATNIPAEELRAKLDEIPKDKRIVLFCHRGFTSYVAARILMQEGFGNVYSLSGGYSFYKIILKDKRGIVMNNEPKKSESLDQSAKIQIDACGMQCPGPILKLADTIKTLQDGETVEISTLDAGFMSDIQAWCELTGNTLLSLTTEDKLIKALIKKGKAKESVREVQNGQTIVVFSNDMDKALASFIIANGAAASGKSVVMFFTFWGLSLLRKTVHVNAKKGLIDKMFAFMLPKGAENLALSKMNMFGLGSLMMKYVMKKKNVSSLTELIKTAKDNGIKLIACSMSMDIMGIKQEELIDGVEIGGVAKYIAESEKSNSNLFI